MTRAQLARDLAGLLGEVAPLWRPAPFHGDPAWVGTLPDVADVLLALADAQLAALEDDPAALTGFAGSLLPAALQAQRLADALAGHALPPPLAEPEAAARDVPGRKWRQALHFAAACDPAGAGHVVDWCCGKAHLGRLLSRHLALPVTGIEHNATLAREGERLARRDGLPVRILAADARAVSPVHAGLAPGTLAVALHACGDLHLALLHAASAAGVDAVAVAPCCYHLTREPHWQPLSAALAGTGLVLARDDLRLAVQETVTASRRVTAQTAQLAAWRLGFDRVQRQLRGVDAYLPTPSRPPRAMAGGFAAFCADLAAHHGLVLPPGIDYPALEAAGRAQHARVRRLELVRHAFRRPLETLLVSDRALFLEERGYRVAVGTFCPRHLTPRNLAIVARRA